MAEEKTEQRVDVWSEEWINEQLFKKRRRLAELSASIEDCNIQIMAAVGEMKYTEYEIRELTESKDELLRSGSGASEGQIPDVSCISPTPYYSGG